MAGDDITRDDLPREPCVPVRRQLRQEVGFGCPVDGCGVPYLQYHHFDPPWSIEHHHDPERMIALCANHHAVADAWTVEQVRQLKKSAAVRDEVAGRFEWMRQDVLGVVGGNYYYETPQMVTFDGRPLIWFERDGDRRLLLSMEMLSRSGQPRTRLDKNDWLIRGNPKDVEATNSRRGSRLKVAYLGGDKVEIRFRPWADEKSLGRVHPRALVLGDSLRFPLVTAELTMAVGGTSIKFGPTKSTFGGTSMTGAVMSHCGVGLALS